MAVSSKYIHITCISLISIRVCRFMICYILHSCIFWCNPNYMRSSHSRLWFHPMWRGYVGNLFLNEPHQIIQFWMIAEVENIVATKQVENCCSHICTLQTQLLFNGNKVLIIFVVVKNNQMWLVVSPFWGFGNRCFILYWTKWVF